MNWELQNFDVDFFIEHSWQKKPQLIRQAFKIQQSPISPQELAGLACEEEVHSRLVMEKGGDTAWQLRYGPFQENDFTSLPESYYSLLVSECEKWLPEFTELIQQFNFLPRWRIDDVMLSYAPNGGSVGPHVDEYDVFLLQVQGQRNWLYDDERLNAPKLIPDLDLAILQSFKAQQQAVLSPGDMLYLPPGIAHHGVAVDDCITCSIGFRAPTATEVLESFLHEIDSSAAGGKRYSDPDLERNRHSTQITDSEINRFREMVLKLVDEPNQHWINAIGKLLSDTVIDDDSSQADSFSNFDQLLHYRWMINPQSKMLYHRNQDTIQFFYNAETVDLPCYDFTLKTIQQLCSRSDLPSELFEQSQQSPELKELLLQMVKKAAILPIFDE